MGISGAVGLSLFMTINFTNIWYGLDVNAAYTQIAANIFVFISWGKGFLRFYGFKKFFAFLGAAIPVCMASYTTWNVILPKLF